MFRYNESRLAKDITKLLKKNDPTISVTYDPSEKLITYGEAKIFLGNILLQMQQMSWWKRKAFLVQFLSSTTSGEEINLKDNLDSLLPRIKPNFSRWMLPRHTGKDLNIPAQSLTENFSIELVIDSESTVAYVTDDKLDEAGISFEKALETARENLRLLNHSPFEEFSPGLYYSKLSDDHDAARILLSLQIESLPLKGDPVAFIPNNHILLLCGSRDFTALQNASAIAQQQYNEQRPLSLQPLIMKDGIWSDFHPPRSDEYAPVRNSELIEMANSYAENKNILDKEHEANDVDIFIAKYMIYQKEETPHYITTSTWTNTVHTWLPRTESITFVDPDRSDEPVIGILPWKTVEDTFADLMEKVPNVMPDRYEVKAFPPIDKIEALVADQDAVEHSS